MEHPVTPASQAGFSLIELLIATAILAVLGLGAALAVGRGDRVAGDAARFAGQVETLRQLAITGQQVRGLDITPDGLQLATLTPQGWERAGQVLRWQGRVRFASQARGWPRDAPDIVILPDGQITGFSIAFADPPRRCRAAGWEAVTCD